VKAAALVKSENYLKSIAFSYAAVLMAEWLKWKIRFPYRSVRVDCWEQSSRSG
jgi:hypothetical protein